MKKIDLTDKDRDKYCVIDGPVWQDACEHGKDTYVASFGIHRVCRHNKTVAFEKFDLYLFPQSYHGTEVCIRYGNEGNEYISPGGLDDFIHRANAPHHYIGADVYHYAAQFLMAFGKFHWEPA